jgi:hypothetical protein
MVTVLAGLVEFERSLIKARTEAARSINDQFPTVDSPKHLKVLETLVKNGSEGSASFHQPNG